MYENLHIKHFAMLYQYRSSVNSVMTCIPLKKKDSFLRVGFIAFVGLHGLLYIYDIKA